MVNDSPAQPSSVDRAERRAAFAKLLRRMLATLDMEQGEIATLLGVPAQAVSRWCDPVETKNLPAADVSALPAALRRALLQHWAEADGLVVSERPVSTDVSDDLRALADVAATGGEMTAAYAAGLADGSISAAEAERIGRAADGVIAAAAAVKERVRPAIAERVVAIRRAAK